MNKFLLSMTLFCLTGCTFIHPVKGMVDDTNERFLGTATASLLEKNATIDITMDSGASCSGIYPRPESTSGGVSASGSFNCSDGRIGHFTFAGTAQGGDGFGKFDNGQKFTFVYGGSGAPEDNAAAALAIQSAGQSMQRVPTPPVMNIPQVQSPYHPVHCSSGTSAGGGLIETNCY